MKLFLVTDLEGVAGVMNVQDWLSPDSRYYETARRLLTNEVNAAISGFADQGFVEFIVCDGHGCGAINIERLDRRAKLMRGWQCLEGPYTYCPFGMDSTYDAIAVIGQHAKAGTAYSHITHTGTFRFKDTLLNGISVGEYGQCILMAQELGIPVIFASGEDALCKEAMHLTPWVGTAAVKWGTIDGDGSELDEQQYMSFHEGAIHLQPDKACELINKAASEAAARFNVERAAFGKIPIKPPYKLELFLRATKTKPQGYLAVEHPTSVIGVLNAAMRRQIESDI